MYPDLLSKDMWKTLCQLSLTLCPSSSLWIKMIVLFSGNILQHTLPLLWWFDCSQQNMKVLSCSFETILKILVPCSFPPLFFGCPLYISNSWRISTPGDLENWNPSPPYSSSQQQSNRKRSLSSWHCATWSRHHTFAHPDIHLPETRCVSPHHWKLLRMMAFTSQAWFMSFFLAIFYCWKLKYSPPNFCIPTLALLF